MEGVARVCYKGGGWKTERRILEILEIAIPPPFGTSSDFSIWTASLMGRGWFCEEFSSGSPRWKGIVMLRDGNGSGVPFSIKVAFVQISCTFREITEFYWTSIILLKYAFARKESAADLLKSLCSGASFAPDEAWEHFLRKFALF